MAKAPALYLGSTRALDGAGAAADLRLPAHHFVTHGVVLGMTGSGKTGLTTVVIEEAINSGIPVLVIDVKGDLPNLLLAFPDFDPGRFMPWVEGYAAPNDARSPEAIAKTLAEQEPGARALVSAGRAPLSARPRRGLERAAPRSRRRAHRPSRRPATQ